MSIHIEQRRTIFLGALTVIGLCACMYIYMVTTTIKNIVAQKNISSQLASMAQKISSKEFDLISIQSKVTLDYAQSLGFSDAQHKTFITPTSVSIASLRGADSSL